MEDGALLALDAANGELVRQASVGSDLGHSPLVAHDGTVCVSGDRLYAFDASDRTTRWTVSLGWTGGATTGVSGSRVIVGGVDGSLTVVATTNGSTLWTVETSGVAAAPGVVGDRVLVGSTDGDVNLPDLAIGETVATSATGVRPAPV